MQAKPVTDADTVPASSAGAPEPHGYTASDVLGRDALVLFTPEAATQIRQLCQEAPEKRNHCPELRAVVTDRYRVPMWLMADLDTTAEARIFLSAHDGDPLELAEDRFQTQSLLLDQVEDALIVRDLEDRIRYWNKGAERLYGWRADEVFGKSVDDFLVPSGPLVDQQPQRILAETGEWRGELRQVTKAKKAIVVESRWKLQHDERGRPHSVLFVNKDVTEKKMLEAEMLRTQRMEMIGKLATAIVHDLNNVLPAMLISIRGLRPEDIHVEGREALEASQFHAEHAAHLISDLLSLAKEIKEEAGTVDLRHLIGETKKILQGAFPKSITISTAIAENLQSMSGNATHLYQVLLNLCLNARDAMPSGGLLTIEACNVAVHEMTARMRSLATPQEYVLVKVTDTGIGIPRQVACKMFEPFFTTKDDQGTGLGLFTVSRIVKSYGGFIHSLSKPKLGAQFFVFLPVKQLNGPH